MDIQDLCDRYDLLEDFRKSGLLPWRSLFEMWLILARLRKTNIIRYSYKWYRQLKSGDMISFYEDACMQMYSGYCPQILKASDLDLPWRFSQVVLVAIAKFF